MSDQQEPNGWELQRGIQQQTQALRDGLDRIDQRIDALVSRDAFLAEQQRVGEAMSAERRRTDDRLNDLTTDLVQEREARIAGDGESQKQLEKQQATQRWVAAAVFLPIVLFLVNLFFLYQRSTGGLS